MNQPSGQERTDTGRPTPNRDDTLYAVVRATLSSVPYVGGALAEVFSATVPSPMSRRTADWWDDLAKRVTVLERSGINMESLANNEEFFGLVRRAAEMASQNNQQEKLEALRNTVINAAAGIDIDADERQIFLTLVQDLTTSHLKMLEFLDDSREYGQAHNVTYGNYSLAGVDTLLQEAFPVWKGKREVFDAILQDLLTRSLVSGNVNSIHTPLSATDNGMFASRTTERGKRFLKFIKGRP